MPSSEGKSRWVALALRDGADNAPGDLEAEGRRYFVRVRVTDPRTGRRVQCARALHGVTVTIWDAGAGVARARPQSDRARKSGTRSTTRWPSSASPSALAEFVSVSPQQSRSENAPPPRRQ